jgi:phosphatidylinositol alpha-1,6-mannosyltransferase
VTGGRRIWLATEDWPPKLGGLSRWSASVEEALDRLGCEVTVLAKSRGGPAAPAARGIHPVTGRSFCALRHIHFMRASLRLRRLEGGWPDSIFCSTWRSAEGVLMARPACPVLCAVQGLEVFAPYTTILRIRRRRVLERIDIAAAGSRYTARRLAEVAPGARIITGINGVDTALFSPDGPFRDRRHALQLVTAGRMVPRKRFDLVILTLGALVERGIDAGLWIAGKGPLEESIKKQAIYLGERVEMLGEVSDSELASLYRSADLFLSPCQSDPSSGDVEGFGLTFVEASACGTAVAGLAEGGVTDAVEHGFSGILSTREGFTGDVLALCGNRSLLEQYGRQGLDRARRDFDIRCVVRRALDLLLECGR